ncbi:hypothetical protein Tsubulata_027594 [Turnera subulata]|uniref:WRKY domain-containing protein n=1 Tax=Turnera subulata TaxID=218843 RepID=A0A9Q0F703_9ROSI|nr:hypothetical protein Tsubulata_027594 [Turnera subulata]
MAKMGDWEQKNLIHELKLGMELAKQLQLHLNSPSSSREAREMLVQKIQDSYQKVLSMLSSSSSMVDHQTHNAGVGIGMSESPSSLNGSPRSEDSDRDLKDTEYRDATKKRNCMPRWTKQVRVNPGMGLEGPLDDGFSWRKYGQKDILGAKHPRGYYRCTHRNVQGCLATKQVQRSDEDPTIFDITYRGKHTCSQAPEILPQTRQPSENQEQNTNINIDPHHFYQQHQHQQTLQENKLPSQELLSTFRRDLKVITQDLDSHQTELQFPPFHFPSTSADQNRVISPPMVDSTATTFMESFSPSAFMPPSSASTSYFSASSSGVLHHHYNYGSPNQNLQIPEATGHHHIISAATSATNSPSIGINDFPFGNVEFDPNFTFDNPGFLH